MIRSFRDRRTEYLFDRIRIAKQWLGIEDVARRRLIQLHRARDLRDLNLPGNRLETLRGDRKGQHSIRINNRWRVCFRWRAGDAHDVEIVDYH